MDDFSYNNSGGFSAGGDDFSNDNGSQKQQQVRSSLTPVTIKQINEATQPVPDGEFQIHNVELNLVSFVGVVRSVQDLTSAIVIKIEDGTGSIEVRKWIDDASDTSANEAAGQAHELNKYVYVTCALKEFNGKRSLQHATIRPITDHNEILYHNLSAIENHLKAQGLGTKPASGQDNGLFVKDSHGMDAPKSMQDKILALIHENSVSMQEGVPVPFISQKLNVTNDIVSQHCATLVEDGKIYSGYDDSAYLAI
ncbi:replication factor A protein 2 [[Candida] anglica]|uniref:Replication factor A protein 2 n=1 Tax=[Candida] anglica TaxID=148631 RepID=A0ABP0EH83_9ASCO